MLRQAENSVEIIGILSEMMLDDKTFTRNGIEKKAIGGSIKVKVVQKINGVNTTLEVPVYFFSSQFTNSGAENKVYENLKKFKNEAVSIAAAGSEDSADWVKIRDARISENNFMSNSGSMVSTLRIEGAFIQRIPKPEDGASHATFVAELMVAKKGFETDKNGNDTNRYKITGAVPGYGGRINLIPFIASNDNVVNALEQFWEEGQTYGCSGVLNFSARTEMTYIPVDFGEPIEKPRTISVSELLITGGTQNPMEEGRAFDQDEVKAALRERKAKLDEMKTNYKPKTVQKKATFDDDF